MQMIDVLKRLAELDAANPAIDTAAMVVQPEQNITVTESLEECGPMGTMSQPHSPASINMTAGSGDELASLISTIMQMSKKPADAHTGHDHGDEVVTGSSSMRSVMDKLNPELESEQDAEEGIIGGTLGGLAGALMGGPAGAALGYAAGSKAGDDLSDDEKTEMYNNTPNPGTEIPDSDQDALMNTGMHNQDQSGRPGGERGTKQPKAFATFEDQLMAEYKEFVAEDKNTA